MCKIEENKSISAYEASVKKVVDTIVNEIDSINCEDDKLLGGVIASLVRRRLGDISVDWADNCRSKGDQYCLVLDCTQSFIESVKDCSKDYIDNKMMF